MSQDPSATPESSRWDANRIRRIRRRLVGATILLLLVLLIVPMLDSDPVVDPHNIALDIPNSPHQAAEAPPIDLPLPPPLEGSNTEILDPSAGVGIVPSDQPLTPLPTTPAVTSQPVLSQPATDLQTQARQLELARREAQQAEQKRLEAVKAEERRQETLKAEAAKKAEDAKKADEAKKAEEARKAEARKAEEAKKAEEARRANAQSGPPKETWISSGGKPDDTARAVAILEGRESRASASSASTQYVIQVGSYRQKALADENQAKIRGLGLNSYVQTAMVDGAETNRLRVGPFTSREEAERALKKLETVGLGGKISTQKR